MYQRLLQLAAESLRRAETAELNKTYTASVRAVDAVTPTAISGLGACIVSILFSHSDIDGHWRSYATAAIWLAIPGK
jgi:hypothetical protein